MCEYASESEALDKGRPEIKEQTFCFAFAPALDREEKQHTNAAMKFGVLVALFSLLHPRFLACRRDRADLWVGRVPTVRVHLSPIMGRLLLLSRLDSGGGKCGDVVSPKEGQGRRRARC